jgi:hypothetical protein
MEMWTPVDPNGFVHEVVHQYEGGPVDHLSAVEVRARRAIVLIPDQDLLGITKCGVRRDLTRGTEETTTGHPDGIQDQGGMAGITIEHLGYPHTLHSHVIDMLSTRPARAITRKATPGAQIPLIPMDIIWALRSGPLAEMPNILFVSVVADVLSSVAAGERLRSYRLE